MSDVDGIEFDISTVPVPDHLASGEEETFDPINNATTVPEEPKRKRILGGPKINGSKDAAPRNERKIKEPKPLPKIPAGGFAPGVEKMYAGIAMAVMPFDPQSAMVIVEIAPQCARAWDDLARQNHAVRRMLVSMMQTTAVGSLIAAHLPLFMVLTMRVMKGDPRVSMLGDMLANSVHPDMQAPGDEPPA